MSRATISPAADQRDLLAERLGLLEVVRREQDRRPLLVQAADVAPELVAQLDVDAGGRLVEDHEARLVQQRAGEQQPAAHPAGELRRAHVALGAQVEDVDHLLGALARPPARFMPEVAAVVERASRAR